MSPRSAEFIEAARRRLRAAEAVVELDRPGSVSAAYYAMLYAARGALSERDVYAKSHKGTWLELRRCFVETGELDDALVARAQAAQPKRERADYEAWDAPREEALRVIALARELLAAVEALIS